MDASWRAPGRERAGHARRARPARVAQGRRRAGPGFVASSRSARASSSGRCTTTCTPRAISAKRAARSSRSTSARPSTRAPPRMPTRARTSCGGSFRTAHARRRLRVRLLRGGRARARARCSGVDVSQYALDQPRSARAGTCGTGTCCTGCRSAGARSRAFRSSRRSSTSRPRSFPRVARGAAG